MPSSRRIDASNTGNTLFNSSCIARSNTGNVVLGSSRLAASNTGKQLRYLPLSVSMHLVCVFTFQLLDAPDLRSRY